MVKSEFRGHRVDWDPSLFFLMEFKDKRTGGTTRIFDLTKDGYISLAIQCGATELAERFEHFSSLPITENVNEKKSKISTPNDGESEENANEVSRRYLHIAVASASVTISGVHVERAIEITSQTIRRKYPVPSDQLVQLAGTTALKQAIQTALHIKKGELDKIAREQLKIKSDASRPIVTVEDETDVTEPEEPGLSPEELAKREKELMG
jgi:hypothetical protein